MSLQQSDYIFLIKGGDSANKNLASLVSVLHEYGFRTQARPGIGSSTLLFARISSSAYAKVVEQSSSKALEFGTTSKDDTPADRPRMLYTYLTSPTAANGVGITPGKGEWDFIEAVMPNSAYLADKSVTQLAKKSAMSPNLATSSFLKVYGSEVALYFEFLKFYILALGGLSIFGFVAYLKSKTYSLTYAFVTLVWSVVFILLWKKRESYLTNLWGVQNAHEVDEYDAALTRASDESLKSSSPAARKENKAGGRFLKELSFIPVALIFTAVLVSYQLGCFVLEIFLSEIYDGPGKTFLTLLPTVLISVFVPILTLVYNFVVDKFLTWESHDNNSTRYDSFVVKTFTLNFLTGYVPLLITSFIYLPFAHLIQPELPFIQSSIANSIHHDRYAYKYLTKIKSQKEFTINQARLDGQFFFFVVTNQIVQFLMKYGLPLVLPHVVKFVNTKILKKSEEVPVDESDEHEWLSAVREYIQLPTHNVHDDYRGLCLQFGYLAMFGPVWTLAPFLSLIFNVITFKLDTVKLSNGKYFRPPIPKRSDSIHPWDLAFLALAWLGSIISPLIAALYRHGTKPPKPLGQFALDKASVNVTSTTKLMLTLFFAEHLFFILYLTGSKISSFFQSSKEIDNNATLHDAALKKDSIVSGVKSESASGAADWNKISIEEIQKQAMGTGKTISPNSKSDAESSGADNGANKGTSKESNTGVSTGVAAGAVAGTSATTSSTEQSLSNRQNRLEELEKKKKDLEDQKATLREKLEAQMQDGDSVIQTKDETGQPTEGIIDDSNHVSQADIDDIDKKLTEKEKESAKKGTTDSIDADSKAESKAESKASSKTPTADESSEEASSKSPKKKGLKKLLKRS